MMGLVSRNNQPTTTMTIQDLIPYVKETRQYGATYVHAAVRRAIHGWEGIQGSLNGEQVVATFAGYGRSLQSGGHKYKAHLNFVATGKPVPSKLISFIR
jgi:hypothetical protein